MARAERLFKQMEAAKIVPNKAIFHFMMNVSAKAGDLMRAESWFIKMTQASPVPFKADAQTYNIMIHACAMAKQASFAEKWIERMEADGFKPDVKSYTSIIDAYSNVNDAYKARAIFRTMVARGIKPTEATYTSLARPFAKRGDWIYVDEIVYKLQNDGISMTGYMLACQMDAYARSNDRQSARAERALRNAVAAGVKITETEVPLIKHALGSTRAERVIAELS